jgi:hypothetical protein
MKKYFLIFICIILAACNSSKILQQGRAKHTNYCDTIRYNQYLDWAIVPVKINGVQKHFIFDTGAGVSIANHDVSNQLHGRSKMNITDANGVSRKINYFTCKKLELNKVKYLNTCMLEMQFIPILHCMCDGILGSTIIAKSNWKICNSDSYIIQSNKKILPDQNCISIPFKYACGNRIFSTLQLNDCTIDSCLVDWGGNFEFEMPFELYEKLVKKENADSIFTKIQSPSGIYGKSTPDTVVRVLGKMSFFGHTIDSVSITFSRQKERRIGVKLLSRFKSVVIDNSTSTLYFDNEILPRKSRYIDLPVNIDLENHKFLVDNVLINASVLPSYLSYGTEIAELNGRKPADFVNYCDFVKFKMQLQNEDCIMLKTTTGDSCKLLLNK